MLEFLGHRQVKWKGGDGGENVPCAERGVVRIYGRAATQLVFRLGFLKVLAATQCNSKVLFEGL